MSYLSYLWWYPTHIMLRYCSAFPRLLCHVLLVSRDCSFLIAPSVLCNIYHVQYLNPTNC